MSYKYSFKFKGSSPEGMRMSGSGHVYAESGSDAYEKADQCVKQQFPTIILDQLNGLRTTGPLSK